MYSNLTRLLICMTLCSFYLQASGQFRLNEERVEERVQRALEEAKEKCKVGRHAEAIYDLDFVLKHRPKNVEALFLRGNAFYINHRYRLSIDDYTQAINNMERGSSRQEPRDRYSAYDRESSRVKISMPELESSEKDLLAELYNNRGVSFHEIREYRRAVEDFERAVDISPSYRLAAQNKSRTEKELGRNRDSRYDYESYGGGNRSRSDEENRNEDEKKSIKRKRDYFSWVPNIRLNRSEDNSYDDKGDPWWRSKNRRLIRGPRVMSQTVSFAKIQKVQMTRKKTVIHLEVTNDSGEKMRIFFDKPGSPKAFYLISPEVRHSYRLRKIRGLSSSYRSTAIEDQESLEFSLEFDPLPEKTKHVNLVEGRDGRNQGNESWNFYDIMLEWED